MVTVLFCDLVGSTALSGVLDPETLRAVTLRYFELMTHQIEAYGGTVEKFIGDAVMAVFGVPTVREDDARRALAAALGMLDALARFNAELDESLNVRLGVRIGVNTGQVVTGSDASARQALVSGETVNIAARLEQNAGADQILLGPDTLLAAGTTVRIEEVGPLPLKGKTEAVTAYRLLGLGGDEPEQLRRFDVPFVGRQLELAALDAALDRAVAGPGAQSLLIHGEAGQGKTRLVREWLRRRGEAERRAGAAPAHGAGRCRQYGEQGTLSPLTQAVGGLLGQVRPGAEAEDALALLAEGLLADGTPSPTLDDTCAALVQVLASIAAQRPVALVLDDCHWAGPLLLDVVDRLVRDLGGAAVLVLRLARPELLELRPESLGEVLPLPGLSGVEARQLAAGLTEVGAHRDGAADLLERSGGNPLYLEQLLGALHEGGEAAPLPATVQALLGARIDALAPAERLTLDLAAVVGREFDTAELAELARRDKPSVAAAMLGLSRRRLVERAPSEGGSRAMYRFTSGLVQEVAYQCMSKRARVEQHERAADLASVRTAGEAAVGGHLERAYRYRGELGLPGAGTERVRLRAAAALGRAGAQALARSDLSWADDLLARAVALRRPDEPDVGPAVRRLGEVRLALGRAAEGRELLGRVAEASTDPVEAAHARLGLAVADPLACGGSPSGTARAVLPVFEAAGDELGQARACLRLGQQLQVEGRHGAADRLLTRALGHAVGVDAEPERAAALGAIGVSLWRGPDPLPSATDRCRALLTEHGGRRRTVRVTLNCPLAVMLALRFRWDESRACLAEAERLAGQLGFAETRVVLPLFGATVDALAGRWRQALRSLDSAGEAARSLGAGALLDTIALDSARILVDTGQWAAAGAILAAPAARTGRPPAEAADLDGLRARIAAAEGRAEDGLRLAGRAVQAAAATDSPLVRAHAALDRAHVLLLLGRTEQAVAAARSAGARFAAKGHLPGVGWARAIVPGTAEWPSSDCESDGEEAPA